MKIEPEVITVRKLVEGFEDKGENGVFSYSGRLNIRPPYQREFVYKSKERNAVIDTVLKGFPLNVMYWSVKEDGDYEIIDGQQRTISLAQYVHGKFAIRYHMGFEKHPKPFHRLPDKIKNQILDYELMIYLCTGTEDERLDWFKVINMAGKKLFDQELRNAVYAGAWLSDAKHYFSQNGCIAYQMGKDYLKGSPIRQDYLETVLKWISNDNIEKYMDKRYKKYTNAEELWDYFRSVIDWVRSTFTITRAKLMQGQDWGGLYSKYKDVPLDPEELERKISELILNEEIQKQSGIYPYVLTGDEKYLDLRVFSDAVKQRVYEKQGGICAISGKKFKIEEMEADHITPWSKGGRTIEENCQMVSKAANRRKGAK